MKKLEAQNRANESAISEVDSGRKQATYIMSPPTADRHATLFLPEGWKGRLDVFRRNPTFIMSHNIGGGPESVLGRWVEVWVDDTRGLMGRAEYDLDRCPLAREVWPMVEAGLIKAVSVGFDPFGVVYYDEPSQISRLPQYAQTMFKRGEIWACFTDQELRECSQVLVGSNREALLQAVHRVANPEHRLLLTRGLDYRPEVDRMQAPLVRALLEHPKFKGDWAAAVETDDDEYQDIVVTLAERHLLLDVLTHNPTFSRDWEQAVETADTDWQDAIVEVACDYINGDLN